MEVVNHYARITLVASIDAQKKTLKNILYNQKNIPQNVEFL